MIIDLFVAIYFVSLNIITELNCYTDSWLNRGDSGSSMRDYLNVLTYMYIVHVFFPVKYCRKFALIHKRNWYLQYLTLVLMRGGGLNVKNWECSEVFKGMVKPLDTPVNSEICLYFTSKKMFPKNSFFCCFH